MAPLNIYTAEEVEITLVCNMSKQKARKIRDHVMACVTEGEAVTVESLAKITKTGENLWHDLIQQGRLQLTPMEPESSPKGRLRGAGYNSDSETIQKVKEPQSGGLNDSISSGEYSQDDEHSDLALALEHDSSSELDTVESEINIISNSEGDPAIKGFKIIQLLLEKRKEYQRRNLKFKNLVKIYRSCLKATQLREQSSIEIMAGEMRQQREVCTQIMTQLREKELEINQLTGEKTDLANELNAKKQELDAREKEIYGLANRIEREGKEKERYEEKVRILEAYQKSFKYEIECQKVLMAEQEKKFKEKLGTLEEGKRVLENSFTSASNQKQTLGKEVKALNEKLEKADRLVKSLRDQLAQEDREGFKNQMFMEITQREHENVDLKKEVRKLQSQLKSAEDQVVQLELQFTQSQSQVISIERKKEQLSESVNTLRNKLTDWEEIRDQMFAEIRKRGSENLDLKKEVRSLKSQMRKSGVQLNSIVKEKEEYKEKVKDLEVAQKQLHKSNDQLCGQIRVLEEEIRLKELAIAESGEDLMKSFRSIDQFVRTIDPERKKKEIDMLQSTISSERRELQKDRENVQERKFTGYFEEEMIQLEHSLTVAISQKERSSKEVQELKEKLEMADRLIASLGKDFASKVREEFKEQMFIKISKREHRIADLEKELEQLRSQLAGLELSQQQVACRERVKEQVSEDNVTSSESVVDMLKEKIKQLMTGTQLFKDQIASLEGERDKWKEEVRKYESQYQESKTLREQITTLNREIKQLKAKLDLSREYGRKLERDKEEVVDIAAMNVKAESDSKRRMIEQYEQRLKEYENAENIVKQLQSLLEQKEKEMDKGRREKDVMDKQLRMMQESDRVKEVKVKECKKEIERLENRIEQMTEKYKAKVREAKVVQKEKDLVDEQVQRLTTDREMLEEQLKFCKVKIKEKVQIVKEQRQELTRITEEQTHSKKLYDEVSGQMDQLKEDLLKYKRRDRSRRLLADPQNQAVGGNVEDDDSTTSSDEGLAATANDRGHRKSARMQRKARKLEAGENAQGLVTSSDESVLTVAQVRKRQHRRRTRAEACGRGEKAPPGGRKVACKARQKLTKIRQEEDESVEDFCNRVHELVILGYTEVDEKTANRITMEAFLDGLIDRSSAELAYMRRPTDHVEALKYVQEAQDGQGSLQQRGMTVPVLPPDVREVGSSDWEEFVTEVINSVVHPE